ncbi:hypothetical protein DLJ53_19620 [Acuticoccus sediminis]|uniref:Serine protease n=1 Tax=Acuticoccus sediminis TaxID=2184697 RepID=A0A8B2NUD7_9HYPH|nr:serine protease [Acuticoccus sediminis]RAH99949.1 hypothetical protein DLJ53_19620 [Acuticoccus sediminis]
MRLGLAGLFFAAIGTASALAQPSTFPGSDYGQVTLRLRESQGSAVSQVIERGDIFQRVGRLRTDDKLREVSDRVVRLDRLISVNGRELTSTCTGTIVATDLVLTNYHCIPGFGEDIRQASILLGYEDEDDPDAVRIPIETRPVMADDKLDFALVRLTAPLPAGLTPLDFEPADAQPGERLTILHHPAGRPKMMTVHECFAYKDPSPRPTELRHVCDTLPGSSGGLIVNVDRQPVGLHHTGGLSKSDAGSYNLATRASVIRAALDTLRPGTASQVASRPSSSSYETTPRPNVGAAAPAAGSPQDSAFQELTTPQPSAGVTATQAQPAGSGAFEQHTSPNVSNRITDAFAND